MYHAVTCPATQQDAYILRYLGEKVCSHVLPWSVSLINASAGHALETCPAGAGESVYAQ